MLLLCSCDDVSAHVKLHVKLLYFYFLFFYLFYKFILLIFLFHITKFFVIDYLSPFIHYQLHREIALVIRDLDYFDVFNDSDLLVDVLVRVT